MEELGDTEMKAVNILSHIAESSVQAFIAAQMAVVDVEKMGRPSRERRSGDKVLGDATDAIKRLVGVNRMLKAAIASLEHEIAESRARLDALMSCLKDGNGNTMSGLVEAFREDGVEEAAAICDALAPQIKKLGMVRSLVREMITAELELNFPVPGDVDAAIVSNWQVVAPGRPTMRSDLDGLPEEIKAVLAGMVGRGADVEVRMVGLGRPHTH